VPRDERIIWHQDVSPADWIGPRLHDFWVDTGSVVPEGFQAYCRVFHPWDGGLVGPKSWAEVASENGRLVHPEMQAHMISRPVGAPAPRHDLRESGLEWGRLPLRERAVLVDLLGAATTTRGRCWFCVWEGWGSLDFSGVYERMQLPGRDYLLFSGPIELALAPLDDMDLASANLWWPEDRSWIVATEVDYAWTYVGGSKPTIQSILTCPQLEALPTRLENKPFYDSDELNAVLDAN